MSETSVWKVDQTVMRGGRSDGEQVERSYVWDVLAANVGQRASIDTMPLCRLKQTNLLARCTKSLLCITQFTPHMGLGNLLAGAFHRLR